MIKNPREKEVAKALIKITSETWDERTIESLIYNLQDGKNSELAGNRYLKGKFCSNKHS